LVAAYFEETSERLVAHANLLASEPLVPPAAPAERKAWEQRVRARRAAMRAAIAELADLSLIATHERRDPG
jgi:hypothetical protein